MKNLIMFLTIYLLTNTACSKFLEDGSNDKDGGKDKPEILTPDEKLSDEQEELFPGSKHIRDGLYEDEFGNLFLKPKTDDPDDNTLIEGAFKRGLGKVDKIELADIIDKNTFLNVGGSYYKDKNNVYHYNKFGQYNLIKDASTESFEVYNTTIYAKDKGHVFYNGEIIKGADYETFETISYDIDGKDIGFFGKDKNSYFKGKSVMTEDEVKVYKLNN